MFIRRRVDVIYNCIMEKKTSILSIFLRKTACDKLQQSWFLNFFGTTFWL